MDPGDGPDVLRSAEGVLLVDWPTRDVPDTLARAGYTVTVAGGPEPDNYSVYEVAGGEVVPRRVGRPPERADLVYSYRPLDELPGMLALAARVGARTLWWQSGRAADGSPDPHGCWVSEERSREARRTVEAAGLAFVDQPYIADAVRLLRGG